MRYLHLTPLHTLQTHKSYVQLLFSYHPFFFFFLNLALEFQPESSVYRFPVRHWTTSAPLQAWGKRGALWKSTRPSSTLRMKRPWRRRTCTEPATASPSASSSSPTRPPTGLGATWCDRRGSTSAWCSGERTRLHSVGLLHSFLSVLFGNFDFSWLKINFNSSDHIENRDIWFVGKRVCTQMLGFSIGLALAVTY